MKLLYDHNDIPHAKKLKDERFKWLQDLGAFELHQADLEQEGFLFGYALGYDSHCRQVADRPNARDRPDEREELIRLDHVLQTLNEQDVDVPTPKTWILQIDDDPPTDLQFPLFVRTPFSSWKRGGDQAKATDLKELGDEMELLRRAFGWDSPILAREWIDIAVAGKWMFGDAPQEIRTWIVDGEPIAWSFHYLHAVQDPKGFPPSCDEVSLIIRYAAEVARPFASRLIAADFVRDRNGEWHFLEAGPGAVSGTAHECVFKLVAKRLVGEDAELPGDDVGGSLARL